MYINRYNFWGVWLILNLWLPIGQSLANTTPSTHWKSLTPGNLAPDLATDTDLDGVDDTLDLCPGTPVGTAVNAYGCPKTVTSCDYTTSSITLTSTGGAGSGTISYVLADSAGTIVRISATPSFSGLTGSHTYMALSISQDGSATGLTVGQSLSLVSASCYDWSEALVLKVCVATPPVVIDADADGIPDTRDLCPNTPSGTIVNAYGCPQTAVSCDYSTSTITLTSTGGSSGSAVTSRYVLTDNSGTIVQISSTPSFTGLTGTATYMVVALTYDGTVTGLSVGGSLSAVSASCFDWSDALVIKVCVPVPASCDYQIGDQISLQSTNGSSGAGIKTSYVLTDAEGKLVLISATPSFSTAGLVAGTYQAYALTYTDDNTITNLTVNGSHTLNQVTAACLAISPALSLKLCGGCVVRCVPLLITRLR